MANNKSLNLTLKMNGYEVENTLAKIKQELYRVRASVNKVEEGTDDWIKANRKLAFVEQEYKRQIAAQRAFRNEITKTIDVSEKQSKSIFSQAATFAGVTVGATALFDVFKQGFGYVKQFIADSQQMALEAKGVEFAFEQLGERGEEAFKKVRISTRGALSDIDIKKSLVEFDNFNISLEEAGTLFEFLNVRAAQTGKSVDKLRDSLVEGLSKESALRIDNLGISTAKLNEELAKTPNFVQAVANIAKTEIARAGDILDDAGNSQEKWNASLKNFQLFIGKSFSSTSSFFYELGANIAEAITPTETLTDKLEEQQLELFSLESRIMNVNTSNKDRIRLINELKQQYPKLLENIDAEKVSNNELQTAIRKVNEELINKIIIARKQDEIEGKNEKVADKQIANLDRERKLREVMARVLKNNTDIRVNAGLTELENARAVLNILQNKYKGERNIFNQSVRDRNALALAIRNVEFTESKLATEQSRVNSLLSERDQLLQELGIDLQEVTGNSQKEGDASSKAAEKTVAWLREQIAKKKELLELSKSNEEAAPIIKEIDELEARLNAILGVEEKLTQAQKDLATAAAKYASEEKNIDEFLKKIREDRLIDQKSGLDKEIAQIDAKFAAEIEKYKNHTNRLLEIETEWENEISNLKEKKAKENIDKINKLEEENRQMLADQELQREVENADTKLEKEELRIARAQELALRELEILRQAELDKVDDVRNAEELKTAIIKNYGLQEAKIKNEFAKQIAEAKKDEVEITRAAENAKLGLIISSLSTAADAFNQGSAAWKAIKIAETTIATYQNATLAYQAGLEGFPAPANLVIAPIMAGVAVGAGLAQVSKIANTPIAKANKPGRGFARGGFTDNYGTGYIDESGHEVAGVAHVGEYYIPKFMRKEPEIPEIINYLETKRRRKLGLYASGGDVTNSSNNSSSSATFSSSSPDMYLNNQLLQRLLERLDNPVPVEAVTYYGAEAEVKRQEVQKKLDKIKQDSKIKKKK
ncbi:coiled-coil domain-containing protein [Aequorivita echinoideorum]|uniref:Uncharacterized protein n=1 Tax=Aequorivita echinoideorum TaxID=1549647 RepID=A0ABS5S388_9FLAO|nr:hypothetical protein [Aequorivita echinoideorum]MBT0607661.1 hypothetical protein [Aequorivita echinoideorum]